MSFSTRTSTRSFVTPGISILKVSASSVSKISVTGKYTRAGTVLSCLVSASRLRWTCSSCSMAIALLPNLDAAWLLTVSPRNRQREHSVDIIRAGCLSIDLNRQRERAVESSMPTLPPVNARGCSKANLLSAGNADRALFRLDLKINLVNTWQLDDRHKVVVLLEDVDRRKCPGTGCTTAEPVALVSSIQRALQRENLVERAIEDSRHRFLLAGTSAPALEVDTSQLVIIRRRVAGSWHLSIAATAPAEAPKSPQTCAWCSTLGVPNPTTSLPPASRDRSDKIG